MATTAGEAVSGRRREPALREAAMPIKVGRVILIGIAAELLAILCLVALVALLGPSGPSEATAFAEKLGRWVGPIAGFLSCLAGGWLVARGLPTHHVANGLALGLFVMVIDVTLLASTGEGFEPVFLVSNVGRVVAGGLGGQLAGRGARHVG
ncbi:MAG: hypothetical protein R2909_17775 [Gemmatimonadales bacterium]